MTCHRAFTRDLLRSLLVIALAALFSSPTFAADAIPAVYSSPAISSFPDPSTVISGYLSMRYIYRTTPYSGVKTSDQDAFGDLRFDITRPKDNRYEFHFLGAARTDLDGKQEHAQFYPFEGVADTYGARTTGIIYEAYAALNGGTALAATKARIGRQSGTRDEPVVFDGIAVDAGGEKWDLTFYEGPAVHYYEVNKHWGDDTVAGAGIDYRPVPEAGMSVDYLRVKDAQALFPEDTTRYDRLLSLKAWQRLGTFTRLMEKYRFLDGEPRDLSLNAVTIWQAADLDASVNYFRQFRTQNELSTDLSLFYDVMGSSAPYQSFDIKVRKFFADRVAADLGYFRRQLLDDAGEGPFNKEYRRSFIDVEVLDLFLSGLSLTLLAEQWESRGDSFGSTGADLSYKIKRNKKEARVSIGTNYSLYKYDYYTELGVREKVRTYYLTGKYPLNSGFSMNGGYEYEHGFENYQTLRLGMRYDF
jgi:hypothetical protein